MALDATVGGESSNSYVTTAEADAYFLDSLRASSWNGVSDKDVALISATQYLDALEWEGYPTTGTQALQFPSLGLYRHGYELSDEIIPTDLKKATYELALYMSENLDLFTIPDMTTKIKVDVIEIEQEVQPFGSIQLLPVSVTTLIQKWLKGSSSVKLVRSH